MQYTNMSSIHWNHKNILLISWDYPFKSSHWNHQTFLLISWDYPFKCFIFKVRAGIHAYFGRKFYKYGASFIGLVLGKRTYLYGIEMNIDAKMVKKKCSS
jgi:hypothetical protein